MLGPVYKLQIALSRAMSSLLAFAFDHAFKSGSAHAWFATTSTKGSAIVALFDYSTIDDDVPPAFMRVDRRKEAKNAKVTRSDAYLPKFLFGLNVTTFMDKGSVPWQILGEKWRSIREIKFAASGSAEDWKAFVRDVGDGDPFVAEESGVWDRVARHTMLVLTRFICGWVLQKRDEVTFWNVAENVWGIVKPTGGEMARTMKQENERLEKAAEKHNVNLLGMKTEKERQEMAIVRTISTVKLKLTKGEGLK